VLAGSGGGYPDLQAALLAAHGLAAVSLAYFGVEDLPDDLREIPLEYFEQALAWIERQPQLVTDRLGVSGTSRGGELALLLASRYAAIRSVVAWVPSGYVWGAVSRSDEPDDGRISPPGPFRESPCHMLDGFGTTMWQRMRPGCFILLPPFTPTWKIPSGRSRQNSD
jgi:hypothetical protein